MTQFDTTDVHPVAALFPLMSDDELKDLAADIAERGLIQPIVLDKEERILDGRNRFLACQLAGVQADYVTYDGDDPDGYALVVNIARRNMTKGQLAVVIARARPARQGQRTDLTSIKNIEVDRQFGVSQQYISFARLVLDHAPDLADAVLSSGMALNTAYEEAKATRDRAIAKAAALARFDAEAPDLRELVDEERMTIDDALAVLNARVTKAETDQQRITDEQDRDRRLAVEAAQYLNVQLLTNVATVLGGVQLGADIDLPAILTTIDKARDAIQEIIE